MMADILFVAMYEVLYILLGNPVSVNQYPFPESKQVGGGVKASLVTGFGQYGSQHMATASFAVGTGDMYGLKGFLGITQIGKEIPDGIQLVGIRLRPLILIHGKLLIQPSDGFLIGLRTSHTIRISQGLKTPDS
jgi:hypothetical protein